MKTKKSGELTKTWFNVADAIDAIKLITYCTEQIKKGKVSDFTTDKIMEYCEVATESLEAVKKYLQSEFNEMI